MKNCRKEEPARGIKRNHKKYEKDVMASKIMKKIKPDILC